VEAICDRVIIINKGNIVADDKLSNLQKNTKDNHVVLVQFKENVPIETLEKIKEVTGIKQLSTIPQGPAGNYQLSTNQPEAVRKQLLELSLQNNWNIVSLQSESNSLEEVFRNLTSNN
jgi:ABC-2 type transport system ATP-binding protein